MSKRDIQEIVSKLRKFYRDNKILPTFSQLADLFHYKSKNAARKLAIKLSKLGYLDQANDGRLIPGEKFYDSLLFHSVQAGSPTDADADDVEAINISDYLIKDPSDSILIRVNGDSMIDAGIQDKDIVVVNKNKNANIGSIVVADVEGEFTVKYLETQNGNYYLRPANKDFDNIYPKQEMKLVGVVEGVIRKY